MIANTFNNQLLYSEGKSMIRSASVISFSIHVLIIGIAMYGIPKFGRQLPPDLTIISFEMLKLVEETNHNSSVLIFNKVPKKNSIEKSLVENWIIQSIEKAKKNLVRGKDLTPFLISEMNKLSKNKTLEANTALIINNALLAGKISKKFNS